MSAILAAVISVTGLSIVTKFVNAFEMEQLNSYIAMKAEHEASLFDDVEDLLQAAEEIFIRRLSLLNDEDVVEEFDRLFPIQEDGTRRSIDAVFDGETLPTGDRFFGLAAFLANGVNMDVGDMREYLAGFHAVRMAGETYQLKFTSLFYNTHDNRLVIFAPSRDDKMMFYRRDAPADFSLSGEDDEVIFDLDQTPVGTLHCSRLDSLIYQNGGESARSVCQATVTHDGNRVGVFGTTIDMTPYLYNALEFPPTHGVNMILDQDGNVLSRSMEAHRNNSDHPHGHENRVNMEDLVAYLQSSNQAYGVYQDEGSPHKVAFAKIDGPSWYFISVVHNERVRTDAMQGAKILFGIIFVFPFILIGIGVLARSSKKE